MIPPSNTCMYRIQDDHRTPSANNAHFQNCVGRQMETMGNMNKCRRYFSEIFAGNNPTKDGCSVADINALCEMHNKHYTIRDAEAYCMLESQAHHVFGKSTTPNTIRSIGTGRTKQCSRTTEFL